MIQNNVYLKSHNSMQVDIDMYKKGVYKETDKMSDLICENYPMVLVMNRFGIPLGFGERSIGDVCRLNGVDAFTFLTVVNFLTDEIQIVTDSICKQLSLPTLILYLHNAHYYFMDFRFPNMRNKLMEAISNCPEEVAIAISNFYDEYAREVNKHMKYEEEVVFPYVKNLLKGEVDTSYNITIFRKQHDQIDQKLSDLKNILIKYYPTEGGYLLNSFLFDIFATEEDLETHSVVEDKLFIPVILTYEKRLENINK